MWYSIFLRVKKQHIGSKNCTVMKWDFQSHDQRVLAAHGSTNSNFRTSVNNKSWAGVKTTNYCVVTVTSVCSITYNELKKQLLYLIQGRFEAITYSVLDSQDCKSKIRLFIFWLVWEFPQLDFRQNFFSSTGFRVLLCDWSEMWSGRGYSANSEKQWIIGIVTQNTWHTKYKELGNHSWKDVA